MAKKSIDLFVDWTKTDPKDHSARNDAWITYQNALNKESTRGTGEDQYKIVSPKVQKKEKTMGSAYVTGADSTKDYEKYVKQDADLAAAYSKIQAGDTKESEYWLRRMGGGTDIASFGRAHAGESAALAGDTYLGQSNLPEGWKARDVPGITKKVVTTPDEDEDEDEDGGDQGFQSVITGLESFSMAELTDDMMLSNRLRDIINTNSPLFKAARTKALQAMQARGLVNSSMAEEAVMNALLAVAMPIAQAEVAALQTNLYYNTDWTNAQKQMANDYYYKTMVMKLGKEMDYQLQYMVQSFGAWGKYGDWINRLGTTPGMDVGAVNWNLNQLPQLPDWFYNDR